MRRTNKISKYERKNEYSSSLENWQYFQISEDEATIQTITKREQRQH
jgi:hypothetical protein